MGKQLKISDLKRVVNVDEMTKIASILKSEESDKIQITNALARLSDKTPSKEVLMTTKLGFILKDLSKRTELPFEIREKALKIRKKWKDFHKNLLLAQKLDVKCDKPTTEKRESSRKQLYEILFESKSVNDGLIMYDTRINNLEFYIFQHCENLVSLKYFSIVQNCKLLFKTDRVVADRFLNGKISPNEVVSQAASNNQ